MMFFAFILVFILVSIVSLKTQTKTNSSQTYFVANKEIGMFALVATLVMTELNTSTLLGFTSLGAIYGNSAVSLALVFLVGLLFYAISVAKKWKGFDGVSVTTFFKRRYNNSIGYIAASILLVSMIGFSANYIKSLTLIFMPLFPSLNEWVLSGVFCIVMLIISLRGGIRTIIRLDILSFLITIVVVPSWLYYAVSFERVSDVVVHTESFSSSVLISLVIITMFTYILAPWYGQKMFTAKTTKVAFLSVIVAAILITLIYGIAILSVSLVAKKIAINIQPQEVFPYLINHQLPKFLQGITYAVLFFIATTTIVGIWNTISSIVIAHNHKAIHKTSLKRSMFITLGVALLTYLLANLFIDQIFEKMVLMNIPISALAFSLLGGFFWKKVDVLASLSSITVGIVGGFSCYFYFGEQDYIWYWAMYIIPSSFISGIIFTFIGQSFPNKREI